MIRRLTAILLMLQLLMGSILLPLGDFSLLKQLPHMYRAYEKVVNPDDKGLLDFVGDYLLGGKTLLGHNKRDLPEKAGSMQFQHAAAFAVIIQLPVGQTLPVATHATVKYQIVQLQSVPSGYLTGLFRPPLA